MCFGGEHEGSDVTSTGHRLKGGHGDGAHGEPHLVHVPTEDDEVEREKRARAAEARLQQQAKRGTQPKGSKSQQSSAPQTGPDMQDYIN